MAPLIVMDPQPRDLDEIFDAESWARLQALGELAIHDGDGRMPADRLEALLPRMDLLIGQTDMPKARLDRAPIFARSSMSRPISCRISTMRPAFSAGSMC